MRNLLRIDRWFRRYASTGGLWRGGLLAVVMLTALIAGTISCTNDQEMIDRHQEALDAEESEH